MDVDIDVDVDDDDDVEFDVGGRYLITVKSFSIFGNRVSTVRWAGASNWFWKNVESSLLAAPSTFLVRGTEKTNKQLD